MFTNSLQWEIEKWKFENKNQIMLFSLVTGKALRIKVDGTVDGLGERADPGGKHTKIWFPKVTFCSVFVNLHAFNLVIS